MAGNKDLRSGHVRSGDEPAHARSALRPRFWLAAFGFVDGVAGVVLFTVLGSVPFVVVSAVLAVVAGINLVVVGRHIRQGPHYQPGRSIPPYHPVEDEHSAERNPPRPLTPVRTRRRRYLVMMGTCLILFVLAWSWVRFYSITAAELMTLVAALIPPFAAIITNADSPIIRGGGENRDRDEDNGNGTDGGDGDSGNDGENPTGQRDPDDYDS